MTTRYIASVLDLSLRRALQAEWRVRLSVVPAKIRTDAPGWEVGWTGTGFLARFEGRQFCLMSRHQLGPYNKDFVVSPEAISIQLDRTSNTNYTGSRITWRLALDEFHADNHDVLAIEMPWKVDALGCPDPFFNWHILSAPPNLESDCLVVVGYPTALRVLDIDDETGQLKSVTDNQLLLEVKSLAIETSALWVAEVDCPVEFVSKLAGNFDGFSGAPVFSFSMRDGQYRFVGMVVRGGHGVIRVLPAPWIAHLLEEACRHPSTT